MTKVFKFGGALMKDADGIRKVASIIKANANDQLIVVVSALGKTTNQLERILQLSINGNHNELSEAVENLKEKHFKIVDALFTDHLHCRKKLSDLFNNLEMQLKNLDPDRYVSYDRIVSFGEKFSTLILNDIFRIY